jgi:hypothetical protein
MRGAPAPAIQELAGHQALQVLLRLRQQDLTTRSGTCT